MALFLTLLLAVTVQAQSFSSFLKGAQTRQDVYQPKPCRIPPAPKNGWFTIGSYSSLFSLTLRFSCHTDYKLAGSSVVSCVQGQWSGTFPHCKIDLEACKRNAARAPQFGSVQITVMKEQVIAEFACDKGYSIVGLSILSCDGRSGGQWLGTQPQCIIDDKLCNLTLPPAPDFGKVKVIPSRHQVIAQYKCEKGYKIEGPSNLTCIGDRLDFSDVSHPSCHLDVKFDQLCDFRSSSSACQYITDSERPNQWQLEVNVCRGKKPSIHRRKPISAIRLRHFTVGDDYFKDIVSTLRSVADQTPPRPKYPMASSRVVSSCKKSLKTRSAILNLAPSPIAKRAAGPSFRLVDGILEIGVLRITYARYIKFKVQAPLDAVAYLLEVNGHCLPDPPGHLSRVASIEHASHSAIERDFCIKLHGRVSRCEDFFVRLHLFALVTLDARGVIRLTNKGASTSICHGFNQEDNR